MLPNINIAMIVSYLARLILLLPDITSTQANKLAEIAEKSHKTGHAPPPKNSFPTKKPIDKNVFSPMHDFNRPVTNSREVFTVPPPNPMVDGTQEDCVPVNETMRKHLIQVINNSTPKRHEIRLRTKEKEFFRQYSMS